MRCKNCKKEINPNFFKCPHCGKPIKRKKKRDRAELALTAGFFGVGALFVILTFFSLFFSCAYYSEIAMIIAVIVFLICVPFIFGNYQGLSQRTSEILGAIVSLPFIGNWLAVVVFAKVSVNYGGLSNAYYIYIIAALVLVDVILLLRSCGIAFKHVGGQMPPQRFRDLAAAGIVDTDECYLLHISIPAFAAAFPHRRPSAPCPWKRPDH